MVRIKMNRALQLFLTQARPIFKDQRFYLLGLITTLVVLHLSLVLNHPLQRNLLSDYILFWAGIILLLWRTGDQKDLDSNLLSSLFGLLLLILVIVRPLYLWNLDTALFLGGPLVAFAGLGLIVLGFRGLRRQWHFLLLLCLMVFPTPILTLEHLLPFTHLTAATSGFLLHYIGFKATYQADLLTLPTGQVLVGYACTGGPLIIYLLKICLLCVIIFPLNWLQKLGLALCAIGTGFGVGCLRVALLATVVNNSDLFHYWHDEKGGQIFLAVATTIFVVLCNWLLPIDEFNSRKKQLQATPAVGSPQWRIPLLLTTWMGMVLAAVYLVCVPNSRRAIAYTFPDKFAIKGWQQVSAHPVGAPVVKDITAANDSDFMLSGKQYRYRHNNREVDVQMRYIVSTQGDIENYLKKFTEITQVKDIQKNIRYKDGIGYYVLLTDSNQAYLTACINPRGGSTVTQAQFLHNRNNYDFTSNRILPWLLGTAILKDNRCLWVQLSTPLDGANSEPAYRILESVWAANYTARLTQFPEL